jgi:putative SOS response-associated peptidase YedK
MCGRITQHRSRKEYAEVLGWDVSDRRRWLGGDTIEQFNLSPGMVPLMLHTLHQGKEMTDNACRWGYRPPWAKDAGRPLTINARLETASTKPFFRHMFAKGRVLIPADGWYEWTGPKGDKQPWYIRLKSNRPMFLAGITNWIPFTVQDKETGVVIITAEAEGSLVDIHSRKPVAFEPKDARLWMDNTLPVEQADWLARHRTLPADAFEWYRISRDVNNAKNNERQLIEALSE